jgi:hypothetical protein
MPKSKHHKKNITSNEWRKRQNKKKALRKFFEGLKRAWHPNGTLITGHPANKKPKGL